ncbi:MAG: excisionase [Microthrixaceae bacterium]
MSWERRLDAWREELALFDQLEGWVTLAEAEETQGVSRSALRSWYRSGQIRSRLVDGPHGPQRLVQMQEVSRRATKSPRIRKSGETQIALAAQIEILQARLNQLEARLARVEEEGTAVSRPPRRRPSRG